MLIRGALTLLRKPFGSLRLRSIQKASFHRMSQEMKSLPRIISDASEIDEFQYFSMKIKDLMDSEQLEYFENVIRKVENIQHPVAEMMSAKLHSPMIDLIIVLITKMANGDLKDNVISEKQKSLSNAVQLIHIGNLVHQRGIFDLSVFPDYGNSLRADDDLILGNKIALLAGDFLLANAQMKITLMRDAEILKIISSAMCDIIDSNFIGESDAAGLPLPFKPGQIPKMKNETFESSLDPIKLEGKLGSAEDEWKFRQIIHRGYLIAKGCRVAAVLSKKQQSVQKDCFELGKHLYLTWQAFVDLQTFKSGIFQDGEKLNLTSAPILFHLQYDPSLHTSILNQSKTPEGVDYQTVYNEVVNGPGIKETKTMLDKLTKNTRKYLANFEASEEKDKIEAILRDFH